MSEPIHSYFMSYMFSTTDKLSTFGDCIMEVSYHISNAEKLEIVRNRLAKSLTDSGIKIEGKIIIMNYRLMNTREEVAEYNPTNVLGAIV